MRATFCIRSGWTRLAARAPAVGAALVATHDWRAGRSSAMPAPAMFVGCGDLRYRHDRLRPVANFFLTLSALAVLGASDMVSVFIRPPLVQFSTPDGMRGRVSAVNVLFIGASNELGEFESGVTAAWFGTVPAVVIGGIGTLLVVALWMRLFPPLRKIDKLADAAPSTGAG